MKARTAGKGDPYWYEWTVGLLKVVEMLRPESGIESVSFQATGVKGWDDVVVHYIDGRTEYSQIKHSRVGKNITFGDLVTMDEQGASLLGSLFDAWRTMKPKANVKCVLFTNRAAGEFSGYSTTGVHRPPLLEFINWLKPELASVRTLRQCRPPIEWSAAWHEWLAQFRRGTVTQKMEFLKCFEIQTHQADLRRLEDFLLTALRDTFQIPDLKAVPLLQALDSALRRWTTTKERVTAEDAFAAMALDVEVDVEHRAPPPPAPFFPSRDKTLAEIEKGLSSQVGSHLVFLSGEPGSGKTSLISHLVNRRSSEPLTGLIGLRYFAFRPITPESPLIPPDADDFVRADRLWYSLLSQLRQGLKGKLRAYAVPLRNDLLSWPEARSQVMRISQRLGLEMGRPFVIAIDGIDHAARAMRLQGKHAKDFFASLPRPDEIERLPVRLLLAGQPPDTYPEYPAWLRPTSPKVLSLGIASLDVADIRVLMGDAKTLIPPAQQSAAAEAIHGTTGGNTLAVVFAVQEARMCKSLQELQARLEQRHLGDGLQQYYNAIWSHALPELAQGRIGVTVALATALCLTPERLTGALMLSAFSALGLTMEQWRFILASLVPLIVEDADGFRVLHNDVRIFLHGLISAEPLAARQQAASMLADHYLKTTSNRWFSHNALVRLLRDAGREMEWARVFNVDWVFEAAALGIPYSEMSGDCVEALRQAIRLADWDVLQEIACAVETLGRWEEKCDSDRSNMGREIVNPRQTFLTSEVYVLPLTEWQVFDLHTLIRDAESLIARSENARALAMLERWLNGLSVADICHNVPGLLEAKPKPGHDEAGLSAGENHTFEILGFVCRSVNFHLRNHQPKRRVERFADSHFEAGWVRASCATGPFDSPISCFSGRALRYLNNYRVALEGLAASEHWPLVRALMRDLRRSSGRFGADIKVQATWWALRSGAALDDSSWLDVLSLPRFGLPELPDVNLRLLLDIARALGWKDVAADPGAIAQRVLDALNPRPHESEKSGHYPLLLRAAVSVGQISSLLCRRGAEAAMDILPAAALARLAAALWNYRFKEFQAAQDSTFAGRLALDLVRIAFELSDQHQKVLLETAKPFVEKYPLDYRQDSLWELHKRVGDITTLRLWVRRWFAADGWVWAQSAAERTSIAEDFLPLARTVGEAELADMAEERLRWLQITYRGHKETAFANTVAWFTELIRLEPTAWRESGTKLWALTEACSALGGDNSCAWRFSEVLGAAAWACGPTDVWQLLTADYPDCGTDYWYYPTGNRIIGGLNEYLCRHPGTPQDYLPAWCLAVGFSRWFNDESVKSLTRLRCTFVDKAPSESERIGILGEIKRLTPGEAQRIPRPEAFGSPPPPGESPDANLHEWLRDLEEGQEIPPQIAARLLRKTLSERPQEFDQVAEKILAGVGRGGAYGWISYSLKACDDLLEIVQLTPDHLLWNLVKAAVKYAGVGTSWTQGISEILQHVLLARAANRGAPVLRSGLDRLLRMHGRWARGGRGELDLPTVKLGLPAPLRTWVELAAHALAFVLASRSAEVIESAFLGIHALAAHEPKIVGTFLELAEGDLWKEYWILNAAEVWATLFPNEMERSRHRLESWLASGPLHRRLQAWVVLGKLADASGLEQPEFPNPGPGDAVDESPLPRPMDHIVGTPTTQRGSFQLVDRFQSSESTIERVEHVTGVSLRALRNEVSTKLGEICPKVNEVEPWPTRIRCYGDTEITALDSESILDRAFDKLLRQSPLPSKLQCPFAQAYLGNEEPWILRWSALPDENEMAWPKEEDLRAADKNSHDRSTIRQRLFLLISQHRVSSDEIILAGAVQVFTWSDDLILRVWWEENSHEVGQDEQRRCPTTLSGRTFVFGLRDWWEPPTQKGERPVACFVGGRQRLMLCHPEFFPARLWRTEFGWHPVPQNPLLWFYEGRPVARYERIHGPPRFTQSGHPRQPLLGRWLVKKWAWESVFAQHGPLRMCDDFQRFPSDVER